VGADSPPSPAAWAGKLGKSRSNESALTTAYFKQLAVRPKECTNRRGPSRSRSSHLAQRIFMQVKPFTTKVVGTVRATVTSGSPGVDGAWSEPSSGSSP
jgi:hypothetical protein